MKRFIYAIALFLIFSICAKAQRQTDASKKLSLAAYVISTLYVDDVNEDKLTEDAIRAMLEQLDPHSTYLDPQEVKDMSASLDGNFDGVGIQFTIRYMSYRPWREDLLKKSVFWQETGLSRLMIPLLQE